MERKQKDYTVLMFKGMCMGTADVVSGVSDGIIAFIVGIYDELIDSIKSIDTHFFKLLFIGKSGAFWRAINVYFLFPLVLGIVICMFFISEGSGDDGLRVLGVFAMGCLLVYVLEKISATKSNG